MDQINLLVFDEAHHTKKNHPYARIIKDFYVPLKGQDRIPRILGMTASPVDAQVDVHRAAAELEGLLHSQIAAISNPDYLQRTICKPKTELVVQYSRLLPAWETELYQSLKNLLCHHDLFQKALAFANAATSQLGPWCADRFWALFLRDKDWLKLEAKTEKDFLRDLPSHASQEQRLGQVRDAREIVQRYDLTSTVLDENLLSTKVLELVKILRDIFGTKDTQSRCIVFVKQRWTAMMLADLFQHPTLHMPGLKVGVLVSYQFSLS